MAKVNQRPWRIPGQRTKRKAWGYTAQVDGTQRRCYRADTPFLASHSVYLFPEGGVVQESFEGGRFRKPDRAVLSAHKTLRFQSAQVPSNGCRGCSRAGYDLLQRSPAIHSQSFQEFQAAAFDLVGGSPGNLRRGVSGILGQFISDLTLL